METTSEAPTGLDVAAASDRIGAELFSGSDSPPAQEQESALAEATPSAEAAAPSAPKTFEVPKSWAKEYHDLWPKFDPRGQEYIIKREQDFLSGLEQYKSGASFAKNINDILTPYQSTLKGLNVTPEQAIKSLFHADHTLRYSTAEQKAEYFKQLAKNYGVDLGQPGQPAAQIDPNIAEIKQQLFQMQQSEQARMQAAQQAALDSAQQEVEAFAADEKAHPYYNEVSQEMILLLQANDKISLQEAYEQAVRLNPVTYAKEVARLQTEAVDKLKENQRLESLPKKKAMSANVKPRDTQRSPTEPAGTMEDTMHATLAAIKARTS